MSLSPYFLSLSLFLSHSHKLSLSQFTLKVHHVFISLSLLVSLSLSHFLCLSLFSFFHSLFFLSHSIFLSLSSLSQSSLSPLSLSSLSFISFNYLFPPFSLSFFVSLSFSLSLSLFLFLPLDPQIMLCSQPDLEISHIFKVFKHNLSQMFLLRFPTKCIVLNKNVKDIRFKSDSLTN